MRMRKFGFKILYNKKKLFILIVLLVVFSCTNVALFVLNPVQLYVEEIYFYDLNGNRMTGKYIKGSADQAVILAPDKGQDMSYYLSVARVLNEQGYHVMFYDLPGQGRSQGAYTRSFYEDNSSAMQIYSAMLALSQLSKLPPANIHYVGHGFGARAVLQARALDYIQPASITLINTEISFKSTIFDGLPIIVDDTQLPWIQNLNTSVVNTNVGLVSTTKADAENAVRLKEILGGQNTVELFDGLAIVEAYAPLDKDVMHAIVSHIGSVSSLGGEMNTTKMTIYNVVLIWMGIGVFVLLWFIRKTLEKRREEEEKWYLVTLSWNFYFYKLLFWIPAVVIGAFGILTMYLVPIAFPVQAGMISLLFGCYGIVMLGVYTYSDFANDAGAGMFQDTDRSSWLTGVIIFIIAYILLKIFGYYGLYYMFPFGQRWIWLLIFAGFNSIPFLILDRELIVLDADRISKVKIVAVYILPFVIAAPFLALLGLQALAMGVFMGMVGLVAVILFGRILEELDVQIIVAATLQGVLFTMYLLSFGIMLN
ncbi:MAG: hypothetical protein GX245_06160 [Eubacteriaceae bacterium]|nr:hypothetical protein [Eubacteriaceae bacterium]